MDEIEKEQQKFLYRDICEMTLHHFGFGDEGYSNLVNAMVRYVQKENNLEDVQITFEELGDYKFAARTNFSQNKIRFNSAMLEKGDSTSDILEVYNTINHEFMHMLDLRDNEKSNINIEDKRVFNASKFSAMDKLGEIKPEYKEEFTKFADLLYLCSREEVLARKRASLKNIEFSKDIANLVREKYSVDCEVLNKPVVDWTMEDIEIARKEVSIDNIISNVMSTGFLNHSIKSMNNEELDTKIDMILKNEMQPTVKAHFIEILKESIDPKIIDTNTQALSEIDIASLFGYEELYDKDLAKHFFEKAKKENRLAICSLYANNKNFDMPESERRKIIDNYNNQIKPLNTYINTPTKAPTPPAQEFKLD